MTDEQALRMPRARYVAFVRYQNHHIKQIERAQGRK